MSGALIQLAFAVFLSLHKKDVKEADVIIADFLADLQSSMINWIEGEFCEQ